MEKSYIIIATKNNRKLPQGFRVHGEKAKTARLEKLIADGWTIREIRPYRKSWVNV